MGKFWAVVAWEFRRSLLSKQFLVSTILIPLIMGAAGAVPVLVQRSQQERILKVADPAGVIATIAHDQLEQARVAIVPVPDEAAARAALARGEVSGVLLPAPEEGPAELRLVVSEVNADATRVKQALERVLTEIAVATRMVAHGLSEREMAELFQPVTLPFALLDGDGDEEPGPKFDFVPLAFAAMLLLSAFFSGNVLMQSVIKEKQNRIVELLFSSVPSSTLMNGKVFAFGCLGLMQLGIWAGAVLGMAWYLWDFDLGMIAPVSLLRGFPHFIAGYAMYAGMFASLGAATRDAQAGGQAQGTFVIIPLVPLMLAGPILMDPHALWVKVMGYIPVFTPGVFLLRSGVTALPWWEYLLSLSIVTVGAWLALRAAGRIFFYGMLMTGRPATFQEITRWIVGR